MNIKIGIITPQKITTTLAKHPLIPKYVDPSYSGFTGPKSIPFPTNKFATHLPDITENFSSFVQDTIKESNEIKKGFLGKVKLMKAFLKNFATGEKWDTKFIKQFPGRDEHGNVQFAKYNNEVVSANDISNIFYGVLCAHAGIPEKLSLWIAKVYSCGLLEPFISGKIPSKKLLKFRDPVSDQLAIAKGYGEYKTLSKGKKLDITGQIKPKSIILKMSKKGIFSGAAEDRKSKGYE